MIDMTLSQVADAVGGALLGDAPGVRVTEVVSDSRDAGPGSLFTALAGARVDGHDFVPQVLAAGAAGALVTRPVDGAAPGTLIQVDDVTAALGRLARHVLAELRARREARQDARALRVVAVTGSYGKTTTKDLLARLLEPAGEVLAPRGSLNTEVGLPLTVLRASESTDCLVLEMGADAPGDLTYLTSLAPPDVAVVLAVGRAHLGGFGGTLDGVARAKSELVTGLRPDGVAVLNADDPRVAAMAPLAGDRRVLAFSRTGTAAADVRAADVRADGAGHAVFRLHAGEESADVTLALVGEHHVANALAAATVALHLGVTLEDVTATLAVAGPASPHRMAVTDLATGVRLVDDAYNGNPDSVRAALRAVATLGRDGRRVVVLGEMLELGEASAAEHAALGAEVGALAGAELLLAVGAGTEPLAAAAEEAGEVSEVLRAADVDAARALLGEVLRPGDVVLVKGSLGSEVWRLADHLTDTARGAAS